MIKHAKKKGVDFGIYAEPEGGRGDWTKSTIGKKNIRIGLSTVTF